MNTLAQFAVLTLGVVLAAVFVRFGLRLMRVDRQESEKSAARAPSIPEAFMGRTRIRDDWAPDARVKAGMIYNARKKRIEISGRLSDDTLNRVFR